MQKNQKAKMQRKNTKESPRKMTIFSLLMSINALRKQTIVGPKDMQPI